MLEFLEKLIAGGVFGVLAWKAIDGIETRWPAFGALDSWLKLPAAWAIVCVVGSVPYWAMLLMAYRPAPGDWRTLVEELFVVLFTAFTTSQVAHNVAKTKRQQLATKS